MTSIARMEEGKATCVGRCFSSVAFPLRQPRRILNLVTRVAVISQSEGGDVGPAVTPPRDCRATPIHPGLVALPGSGAVLETPGAALGVPLSSLTGATGGHVVERVGSGVTASFIQRLTLRHEPGSQPPREGSDVRPVIGFFHGHNLGEADEQDVAENLRGLANVRS